MFSAMLQEACYFKLVWHQEAAGFLLAFAPGAGYDSLNYRWFSARFEWFTYIDCIVIAPACVGFGFGRALYKEDLGERNAWLGCMQRALEQQPFDAAFKKYLLEQLEIPAERIRKTSQ